MTPPPSPRPSPLQPSKKKQKPVKIIRYFRSIFRSLPILTPSCKFPTNLPGVHSDAISVSNSGTRVTGTLFGFRKARVSLALQDNPRCLPIVVIELPLPTGNLLKEMTSGLVRIALESEKRAAAASEKTKLLDEPVWTVYCNGRKAGYGMKREPAELDMHVMELLQAVSMGGGVLPYDNAENGVNEGDGELTYMRANFDRVTGSKDSEALYMVSPDGQNGPELTIFLVRV
ncbi:protein MIZU-KUSSEI 1-like [Nymphaea colorata]|uniref:Protein MIZU-KUSSEI 1 n=1 Tax=Nymphaea colorata TaxID=210225 RepID=A0A5K1GCF6_9MAGN|nr:protein MIZU-KUSSEI 1-like [Nymphaea colorata]